MAELFVILGIPAATAFLGTIMVVAAGITAGAEPPGPVSRAVEVPS